MRIECPGCAKVYNIPDDRLPKKKTASFNCQECNYSIKLDLKAKVVQGLSPVEEKVVAPPPGQLDDPALKKKILRALKELPPMPQVVSKVNEIMANPKMGFKDIAKILETDQSIAALLLKTSNSPYYGMSGKVGTIHQAIVLLGYETLEEVLTVVVSSALLAKRLKGYGMDSGTLWQHSLAVAIGSKVIAGMINPSLENEAFSAGLIHDSGKLVLDRFLAEKKASFKDIAQMEPGAIVHLEKQFLGFDHAELAFKLCDKWNIPQTQSIAIRFHHTPLDSQGSQLAYILHAADLIALMDDLGIDGLLNQMENGVMDYLGLEPGQIEKIHGEVKESLEKLMQNF